MLRLAILAVLLCLSCEIFKPGEPIEFTTVKDYISLSYPHRANCVFQDSVSLRDFWLKYCPDTNIVPLRFPPVDFNARTLICVFMGTCPTTGYSTTIVEVRDFDDEFVVSIAEDQDGDGACQILTYPQHLITIPKTTLPIGFTYEQMVTYDGDLDSESCTALTLEPGQSPQ